LFNLVFHTIYTRNEAGEERLNLSSFKELQTIHSLLVDSMKKLLISEEIGNLL
jgi:hypothetical protein